MTDTIELCLTDKIRTDKRATRTGAVYSTVTTVQRPTEIWVELRLLGDLESYFDDELAAPLHPVLVAGGELEHDDPYRQGYTPYATHAPCIECQLKLKKSEFLYANKRPQGVRWVCKKCMRKHTTP